MSSSFGENIRLMIFGQSHGEMVGAVLDGLPPGEPVDLASLQTFVDRRAPGRGDGRSARQEADRVQIVSGLYQGRTCGAPLCLWIANTDARPSDYAPLLSVPRPSHADYTAALRYGGYADPRGGGHLSGRLTAPFTAAGAICSQILARRGIAVSGHIAALGGVVDPSPETHSLTKEELALLTKRSLPVFHDDVALRMQQAVVEAAAAGDSLGGVLEVFALGVPPGLGGPMFGGVENRLAAAAFAIPGLCGVEFGCGFAAAAMRGSEYNDRYFQAVEHSVRTYTNHHGGVLGGITSGMPLVMRAVVKPTPSIALPQCTLDLTTGRETELRIQGRHDACIALRALPCLEAAVAFVLLDLMLDGEYRQPQTTGRRKGEDEKNGENG